MSIIGKGTLYIDGKAVGDTDSFTLDIESHEPGTVGITFPEVHEMSGTLTLDSVSPTLLRGLFGKVERNSTWGKFTTPPILYPYQTEVMKRLMRLESERLEFINPARPGVEFYRQVDEAARKLAVTTKYSYDEAKAALLARRNSFASYNWSDVMSTKALVDNFHWAATVRAWQRKPLKHLNTAITDMTYHVRRALRHWS
jgi:hypothetical protein